MLVKASWKLSLSLLWHNLFLTQHQGWIFKVLPILHLRLGSIPLNINHSLNFTLFTDISFYYLNIKVLKQMTKVIFNTGPMPLRWPLTSSSVYVVRGRTVTSKGSMRTCMLVSRSWLVISRYEPDTSYTYISVCFCFVTFCRCTFLLVNFKTLKLPHIWTSREKILIINMSLTPSLGPFCVYRACFN